MTPVRTFADKTVALFGLGGSGLATALALQAGGAGVVACDDDPARMANAAGKGIETGDLRTADWSRFSALILSPGVPLTHPEPHWSATLAQDAGVEVIGDIELFCRERAKIAPDAPFVAITGTNGKSTTTALIAHILREAGKDVQMGGNIGTAILSLEPPGPNRIHVIECSSFQIDLAPSLKPTIGVLLNISPDHLDRHGTMANYAAIKERLVAGAKVRWLESTTISAARSPAPDETRRRNIHQCQDAASLIADISLPDQTVLAKGHSEALVELGLADLGRISSLRGAHNAQNAAFACRGRLARARVEPERIRRAITPSPVCRTGWKRSAAAGAHLRQRLQGHQRRFDRQGARLLRRMFWILGGKAKEGGIDAAEPLFPEGRESLPDRRRPPRISRRRSTAGSVCPLPVRSTRPWLRRRRTRRARHAPEPVVLLSPACASYDQYPNFEVRGDHFRDLVRALPGLKLRRGSKP